MDFKNKKGFTLIEMAIALIILSLLTVSIVNMARATYNLENISKRQDAISSFKNAFVGYVSQYGRIPYPDVDGDGIGDNTALGMGNLPYLDLQISQKDIYGMKFKYDATLELADSTITNFTTLCTKLDALKNNTTFPKVQNDIGNQSYSVVAVLISRGTDKRLTGENMTTNRIYEMESNIFNETTNNDTVIQINGFDLISRLCK